MATPTVKILPAEFVLEVYAGDTPRFPIPITVNGVAIDVAAEYPNLVSRLKIGDAAAITTLTEVEDTNVLWVTLPELTYEKGRKDYWELRDLDADTTWLTAPVKVKEDRVP